MVGKSTERNIEKDKKSRQNDSTPFNIMMNGEITLKIFVSSRYLKLSIDEYAWYLDERASYKQQVLWATWGPCITQNTVNNK